MLRIFILSPFFNESSNLFDFVNETDHILKENFSSYEIILINDGSFDNWEDSIKRLEPEILKNLIIIDLSRNFGKEWALSAGVNYANGNVIVIMDSDLQDPPALIPQLIEKLNNGFDVVHARSIERSGESFLKKKITKSFYDFTSYLTDIQLPEHPGNYMAINRTVLKALQDMPEQNRYFKMLVSFIGFRVGFVDYQRPGRQKGGSKFQGFKLVSLALDIIFSYSTKPLRIFSFINLFSAFLMISISCWGLIQKLVFKNATYGWASTFMLISIGFSLLFIFMAILSEYIGRILLETKRRPLYFVTREIRFE